MARLIPALLLVVLSAVPGTGSLSRVSALGDVEYTLFDESNIWRFPSSIVDYSYLFGIDVFGVDDSVEGMAGFIHRYSFGVVGLYASNRYMDRIGAEFVPETGSVEELLSFPVTADQKVDLFYGFTRPSWDAGIRLSWWGGRNSSFIDTLQTSSKVQESRILKLQLGAGIELSQKVYWENSVEMSMLTARHEENGIEVSTMNSGYDLTFRSRYIRDISRRASIIPFMEFSAISLDVENSSSSDTLTLEGIKLVGGVGVNHDMGQASVMMAELFFETASTTYKHRDTPDHEAVYETVYYTFPGIRVGLDTPLFSWLDIMMGFKKSIGYIRSEYPEQGDGVATGMSVDRKEEQPFEATLGLGMKLREMEFDLMFYPMECFESFRESRDETFFFQASLTYRY